MNLFELSAKISVDDSGFKKSMENAQKVSKNVSDAIKNLQSPLDKAKSGFNAIAHPVETAKANIEKLKNATEAIRHPIETFKNKVSDASTALETKRNKLSTLAAGYDSAKKKVADITKEFNKSAKESGTSSQKTQELAKKLNEAEKEAEEAKKELDDYSKSVSKAGKNSDSASKSVGNFASKLGKGLKTAGKIGVAAVGAAAAGITALTTAAVNNYAEYEQLVGGVETLFKGSADKVQEYAANAYKTAGLSANDYMNTVTSFSASLLQSLGGDTDAAAKKADVAITDMADNANKMGTSIEMLQTTYAGFAKQNFTMLDNLKLGYGGTKEEMQRLLDDASKISGIKYDISSFADITDAIHVMQEEMGIAGATALEASTTIQGSIGAMSGAWTNLVTGLADENADLDVLMSNFVESFVVAANNIIPQVSASLTSASTLIQTMLPSLLENIVSMLDENLPILAEAAISIIQSLIDGISQNQEMLMETAFETITFLAESLIEMLPQIVELGLDLIVSLANGIAESLDTLIPTTIDVILKIVNTLTNPENLTMLLNAAIAILTAIGEYLLQPETINRLLDAAIGVVKNLVAFLMENLSPLLDAAIDIIMALVEYILEPSNLAKLVQTAIELVVTIAGALVGAAGELVAAAGELILKIIAKFKETNWGELGKNLVDGFKKGIQNAWNNLKQWFTNLFGDLIGIAKKILGIASPSKVFKKIGGFTAEGFGAGFEDEFAHVKDDMEDALNFDDASVGINASIRKVGAGTAVGAFGGTSIGNININIDGAKYSDEQSLAAAIALEIQNMTDRRAAVYA